MLFSYPMRPLDAAFEHRDAPMLAAALGAMDSDVRLFNGWTPLQQACHMSWLEGAVVAHQACPEGGTYQGPSASALAARHGHGFLMALHQKGVPIATLDPEGLANALPKESREFWRVWLDRTTMVNALEDLPAAAPKSRSRM